MMFVRVAAAHAAVLFLTSAHHWYGAVRFDTPWRAHVIHLAAWIGAVLVVLLSVGWLARGRPLERWAAGTVLVLSMLAAVAWLGLFEGGYNHLVKNVLYFGGVPSEWYQRVFPLSTYEPPRDWVFELTGIAQLPLGLLAGWSAIAMWRFRRAFDRAQGGL